MSKSKAREPRTLREAHEVLQRLVPQSTASVQEWLAFRRHSAQVYLRIADVDRFHHHEALYWAKAERDQANLLQEQGDAAKRK